MFFLLKEPHYKHVQIYQYVWRQLRQWWQGGCQTTLARLGASRYPGWPPSRPSLWSDICHGHPATRRKGRNIRNSSRWIRTKTYSIIPDGKLSLAKIFATRRVSYMQCNRPGPLSLHKHILAAMTGPERLIEILCGQSETCDYALPTWPRICIWRWRPIYPRTESHAGYKRTIISRFCM